MTIPNKRSVIFKKVRFPIRGESRPAAPEKTICTVAGDRFHISGATGTGTNQSAHPPGSVQFDFPPTPGALTTMQSIKKPSTLAGFFYGKAHYKSKLNVHNHHQFHRQPIPIRHQLVSNRLHHPNT